MLKIYHVRGTRSVRPLWLCFELELPVEIVSIDFSPAYRSTPEWRAISPAGKVPAMSDGELTMFESGAMIDYVLERYGEGRLRPPAGTALSALYHQWCWFSEATLTRPVGIYRIMRSAQDAAGALATEGEGKLRDCLAVVDQALTSREFLVGEAFTAADIMMGYSLQLITNLLVLRDDYPHSQAYLERLMSREACQRAMAA